MKNDSESLEMEVIPTSGIEAITRAEVDVQIATAHRFPRSMASFKKRALEMATLDEETAASCMYSRPVGGGKFAEGMSVRMAEIVGASYGNLRVGAMIISQTERQVVCRGFAHDLESNFASTSEVVEATIKKDGKPYDERMRVVIAKACLAKARRDATFQVVPKALCKPVETEARRVAIGDASTIAKRRGQVVTWIEKLGIDKARVWKALSIAGEDDIGIDQLTILTGLKTAIKDGEVSVDEAFPAEAGAAKPSKFVPPAEEKKPEATEQPTVPAPEVHETAEPRESTVVLDEAHDGNNPPIDDQDALCAWLRQELAMRGLEEKDVVAECKKRKWCGAATRITEMPSSGRIKLAANIDEITKEIGG